MFEGNNKDFALSRPAEVGKTAFSGDVTSESGQLGALKKIVDLGSAL